MQCGSRGPEKLKIALGAGTALSQVTGASGGCRTSPEKVPGCPRSLYSGFPHCLVPVPCLPCPSSSHPVIQPSVHAHSDMFHLLAALTLPPLCSGFGHAGEDLLTALRAPSDPWGLPRESWLHEETVCRASPNVADMAPACSPPRTVPLEARAQSPGRCLASCLPSPVPMLSPRPHVASPLQGGHAVAQPAIKPFGGSQKTPRNSWNKNNNA